MKCYVMEQDSLWSDLHSIRLAKSFIRVWVKRLRCPIQLAVTPRLCVPPTSSSLLLFLSLFTFFIQLPFLWSPSQELQCGPCYGPSDGAALRLRPDIHHRKDHLCLLPTKVGGAAIPSESEGGGRHAQVQTPGQISGNWTVMHQPLGLLLQHLFTSSGNVLWHIATGNHRRQPINRQSVCFFSVTPMKNSWNDNWGQNETSFLF